LSTAERVRQVVAAADGKRAQDIVVLDVRDVTAVADYFVICSGATHIQVRAIVDAVEDAVPEAPRGKEGYREGRWVCLDYGDLVVHVFQKQERDYYDLERLWGDAPRVESAEMAERAQPAAKGAGLAAG
jgi:ribosome-associated protein